MYNNSFLNALFGSHSPRVHVTDFKHDPTNIPKGEHLRAWAGDSFSRYTFAPPSNQYFCISLFTPGEFGMSRRRKALFESCPVIVLDDVREKLDIDAVRRLPDPTYILETSQGSEQWGYLLTEPCTQRSVVENLLDGLVANGLAPDGKDPGMKGVTRYVRLPDGVNNKASKLFGGMPWQCRLLHWSPFTMVRIEELAAPFNINLLAPRREQRLDGAADIADHPLLQVPELISVKEIRSDGRFDITCPWVDEHTGRDDSGSAVFTNQDGTLGFKCHHGSCEHRTGKDLLQWLESHKPGFMGSLTGWQAQRAFEEIQQSAESPHPAQLTAELQTAFGTAVIDGNTTTVEHSLKPLFDHLQRLPHDGIEARQTAGKLLQLVDQLDKMAQVAWHKDICSAMYWTKKEFTEILKAARETWYEKKVIPDFYDETVFIAEANRFYDRKKRLWFTPDAYQNYFGHVDIEAKKEALIEGRVAKADRIDYAPKQPAMFTDRGITYCNAWVKHDDTPGMPGDASPWLKHIDALGWERKHILQWMAYTLLYPETKINHALVLGSGEGAGKDFILTPLLRAMTDDAKVINGETLLSDFNAHLLNKKFLLVNESELGDRREAQAISAKLKPLCSAPPERLEVNQKGIPSIDVRNIVSVALTTNSQLPFRLSGQSRRYYALWSDVNTRDRHGNMLPAWRKYWTDMWQWMNSGGDQYCIHYLRNDVDLSDFNPGAPPPMTQFLRDITNASKSAPLQTLESFIDEGVGIFDNRFVTVNDALNTLRSGEMLRPDLMQQRGDWFTAARIKMLLRDAGATLTTVNNTELWCVKGDAIGLSPADVWNQYLENGQPVTNVVKIRPDI